MVFELIVDGEAQTPKRGVYEDFAHVITSGEVTDITQTAFTQLLGEAVEYSLPPLTATVAVTVDGGEAGHCTVQEYTGPNREVARLLYVHTNFPRYLTQYCPEIRSSSEAVQVAAVYARACDVVAGALSRSRMRRHGDGGMRFSATMVDKYWPLDYRSGNVSLVHRAAGTVTLMAMGQDDVDITQAAPYQPHIAGLMNPLPPRGYGHEQGFNRLSTALLSASQ